MPSEIVPHMSAAEFLTLRQACALGQQEAADYLGSGLRSVQHWEMGSRLVPAAAAEALGALDDAIRSRASRVLAPIAGQRRTALARVRLVRYRTAAAYAATVDDLPWPAHVAVIWRISDGLSRLGVPYTVTWAEDQGGSV